MLELQCFGKGMKKFVLPYLRGYQEKEGLNRANVSAYGGLGANSMHESLVAQSNCKKTEKQNEFFSSS